MGLALAAWLLSLCAAIAGDDPAAFAKARETFWRAVAAAYSVDAATVEVFPRTPEEAGPELAGLAIGDLRAFRTVIGGSGEVVQGFASLAGRPPAFARFRHIGSAGIASLLEAMDVLAPTLPLPAMVERIAWTHPDFGLPLDLPDRPWTHETTAKGASLSWFTRSGARNGALTFWRVSLHVDRHHNADITRTTIPNPFLLKGSVAR